jgi:hypothetical protein
MNRTGASMGVSKINGTRIPFSVFYTYYSVQILVCSLPVCVCSKITDSLLLP